jgi:predicted Fe-Mo cluster-binding NifX family protein
MKICLAAYKNRLAALFDNAAELRLYTLDHGSIYPAGRISLPHGDPSLRVSSLVTCGVNLLICGAISGCTTRLLQHSGIQVLPWIKGELDEVLNCWQQGTLEKLAMPGCKGQCRQKLCK